MIPALLGILGRVAGSEGAAAVAAKAPKKMPSRLMKVGPAKDEEEDKGTAAVAAKGTAAVAAVAAKPATGLAKLTKSMKPLADGIGQVQKGFTDATAGASKLASGVGLINAPLNAGVDALKSFGVTVTMLGDKVSQFTRLANPALTNQFQFASDDLAASIGKGLIPVLQYATKFTKMFGDAVFTLSGPLSSLLDSVLKPWGDFLPTLTNTIGPVIRMFGMTATTVGAVARPLAVLAMTLAKIIALPLEAALGGLAVVLEVMLAPIEVAAILLGRLADALSKFIDRGIGDIRKLLGLKTMSGASTGAAVRNVSMGGVEEYQKKAFQMAFSLGTAGSADERTAGYAQKILEWLDTEGSKLPNRIVAGLAAIAEKIIAAIPVNPFGPAPEGMNAAERVTAKLPGGETAVKAGRYLEEKIAAQRERGRRGDILGSVTLGLLSDGDL